MQFKEKLQSTQPQSHLSSEECEICQDPEIPSMPSLLTRLTPELKKVLSYIFLKAL